MTERDGRIKEFEAFLSFIEVFFDVKKVEFDVVFVEVKYV